MESERSSLRRLQLVLRPAASQDGKAARKPADQHGKTNGASPELNSSSRMDPGWSEYSDLAITCKQRTWSVHKLVLCTQSEFFRKACQKCYKEGNENKIDLDDDDPEVVNAMLSFLYESEYKTPADCNRWAFHTNIAALADKYFIKSLQDYAELQFKKQLDERPSISDFADAIAVVYDSGNESLKQLVVAVTAKGHRVLFAKPMNPKLLLVLRETPGFAADVAESLSKKLAAVEDLFRGGS